MLLIENGTVYTPQQVIPDGAVLVEGRQIQAVGRRAELAIPAGTEHLDARDGYIVPGFVDMHLHGARGSDALDGKAESLQKIAASLPQHGVTACVPTLVTAPLATMLAGLQAARQAGSVAASGAEILGIHVEGPYLNPQERGAHRADYLRIPQQDDPSPFFPYTNVICTFTLAPELPGALSLIAALRERDVLVAAGHSIAIDTELQSAVEAGLTHVTHLFNNMGTLRRVNLRRVAGMVESALLDDRLSAEIIGDGYHLAPSLMKLALKVKGAERLALVTDASPLTGLPPGSYTLWGSNVIAEADICYVADRSAYAGSVATMDRCLRVAIEMMDTSLGEALRMISLTPATILGVDGRKGSLATGKDADIVILDGSLHVVQTIIAGHLYQALEP